MLYTNCEYNHSFFVSKAREVVHGDNESELLKKLTELLFFYCGDTLQEGPD